MSTICLWSLNTFTLGPVSTHINLLAYTSNMFFIELIDCYVSIWTEYYVMIRPHFRIDFVKTDCTCTFSSIFIELKLFLSKTKKSSIRNWKQHQQQWLQQWLIKLDLNQNISIPRISFNRSDWHYRWYVCLILKWLNFTFHHNFILLFFLF